MSGSAARERRLVLPGVRPVSWNTFYSGRHWAERKKEVDRIHALVREQIDPNTRPFERPIDLTVAAYFKDHPQDASNVCAKVFEDALKGWWIVDDSPAYVASVTTVSAVDKANPRVEIFAVEVEQI